MTRSSPVFRLSTMSRSSRSSGLKYSSYSVVGRNAPLVANTVL